MNLVAFVQVSKGKFKVYYDSNQVYLGDLLQEIDGYFYYYPEQRGGCWSAEVLREIADKLDEINKPWDEEVQLGLGKNSGEGSDGTPLSQSSVESNQPRKE